MPGAEYAWLYESTDAGRTWTHVESSYLRHTPRTYDDGPLATWTFALSSDGALAVARVGQDGAATLRVSTDGGVSFGPVRPLALPSGVAAKDLNGVRIAAGSSRHLIETAPDGDRRATYFVSSDAGIAWRAVAQGSNEWSTPEVGWTFPAGDFGYRMSDDFRSVLITSDAGATTSQRPFAR